MVPNRMAALVACMFVACLTQGQLFAFSVYGGSLKANLELTQGDLDTIATFPYLSGLFVWVPGRLNDRWGPRAAIRCGAAGMAVGTVAYWAVARQLVAAGRETAVPALTFVMFLTLLVHGAVTAGMFSSLVRNFPLERGVVAGIGKAWVGLSSGILTQLFASFVGVPSNAPETLDFLLLLAGACLVAAAGPATFVVLHPPRPREPGLWTRFAVLYFAVWVTAALVTASALLGRGLHPEGRRAFGVAIVVAVICPVFVTCNCWGGSCSGGGNTQAAPPQLKLATYSALPHNEDGETDSDSDSGGVQSPAGSTRNQDRRRAPDEGLGVSSSPLAPLPLRTCVRA